MNITPPIVVDLGETREGAVTQFRSGHGQLVEDVKEVLRQVRSSARPERPGRIFVPIVLIYRRPQSKQDETVVEVWQPDRTGE